MIDTPLRPRDRYLEQTLLFRDTDFVAIKDGERTYIQATESMGDERTKNREFAALRSIRDAYPKIIVVREGAHESDVDGVKIVGVRDFFLS